MVGVTEIDNDEAVTVDKDGAGTEVVMETVKLVGVALPPVCVDVVEISVVVVRVDVRVPGGITTVVGGSTEVTVVVNEEGGSDDFEESGGFFLPPSSLLSSEHVRIIRWSTPKPTCADSGRTYCSCCCPCRHFHRSLCLCHHFAPRHCHLFFRHCAYFDHHYSPVHRPCRLGVQVQVSCHGYRPTPHEVSSYPVGLSFVPSNGVTSP